MKLNSLLSICFSAVLLLTSSCKEKEKEVALDGYTISGKIKGLETGWVKLSRPIYLFDEEKIVLDSTKIVNGRFSFNGKVNYDDFVILNFTDEKLSSRLFLENSAINIDLDVADAEKANGYIKPKISGSKGQDLYERLNARLDSIKNLKKYDAFKGFRSQVLKAKQNKDNLELQEQVKARMLALETLENEQEQELKALRVQFIKDYPNSTVPIYLLGISFSEVMMTREEMTAVYNLFKEDARKARKFSFIKKTYVDYVERFALGAIVSDFTLKTLDGSDLTLSKVEGEYIFVDFWASWCIPCRASFPHLKDLYSKYKKDGFTVVAVATSDKEDRWRKAIKDDQTVWNHVIDNNPGAQGEVAKAFGVPFLPTTFLLDNNRKIIGRNLKEEELDEKLKELFGY